jgi:hypothetical protein
MADLPGRLVVEVRLSHPGDKDKYFAGVGARKVAIATRKVSRIATAAGKGAPMMA